MKIGSIFGPTETSIRFKVTSNIKFPIVTINDGTGGDCDNLSSLAAAIMKARGLDSAVPTENCFEL